MGALKSAMMDIGYSVLDFHDIESGITNAMHKYSMSEDDVKMCVLFVEAFDGPWGDYLEALKENQPSLH